MKRLQIQLDDGRYEALRRMAYKKRQSMASIVRQLLDRTLAPPRRRARSIKDFGFVGAFDSGKPNRVSEEHDRVLGERRW